MEPKRSHPFVPDVPGGCDLSKDRILLHCCCAPCSSAILEWMVSAGLYPGIFFSNANIIPFEEYQIRKKELQGYAQSFGLKFIEDEYDHASWLASISNVDGYATMSERRDRCLACFRFRLLRAAEYARSHGYGVLSTTLASSRWKSLEQVDAAGRRAIDQVNASSVQSGTMSGYRPLVWWNQNWRRGGLQERRNSLVRERKMYNQSYCGCEFSFPRFQLAGSGDRLSLKPQQSSCPKPDSDKGKTHFRYKAKSAEPEPDIEA